MQVTKKTDIVSWRLTRQDLWDGFNLFYDHYILICIPAFAIRLLVNDVFFPTGNKIPAPPHKKKKKLWKEPVKNSVTKQRLALIPLSFCTRIHQKARQTCRPAHPSKVNTKEPCLFIFTLVNEDNLFSVHSHERGLKHVPKCCSSPPSGGNDFI